MVWVAFRNGADGEKGSCLKIAWARIPATRRRVSIRLICYVKALPPAPLAVAGFLVTGLGAWQSSDRLAGLLGFGCLVFVLLVLSVGMCVGLLVSGC